MCDASSLVHPQLGIGKMTSPTRCTTATKVANRSNDWKRFDELKNQFAFDECHCSQSHSLHHHCDWAHAWCLLHHCSNSAMLALEAQQPLWSQILLIPFQDLIFQARHCCTLSTNQPISLLILSSAPKIYRVHQSHARVAHVIYVAVFIERWTCCRIRRLCRWRLLGLMSTDTFYRLAPVCIFTSHVRGTLV